MSPTQTTPTHKIGWLNRPGTIPVTWNPMVGCSKVGAGCANCYAEPMANRLAAMSLADKRAGRNPGRKEAYEKVVDRGRWNGQVAIVPGALDIPKKWKAPRTVFVGSMTDPFHKRIHTADLRRLWDVMWSTPQHTYIILTKRYERAAKWLVAHAYRRQFGRTEETRLPFRFERIMYYENAIEFDECGWYRPDYDSAAYDCRHPRNMDAGCYVQSCPLGVPVDGKSELLAIGKHEADYHWIADEDGGFYAEDPDMIRLYERPRRAMAANVWLGFSAWDQASFEAGMRWWRRLRGALGPYAKLFVSLEPLLGPINFTMPYGLDEEVAWDVPDAYVDPPEQWNSLGPDVGDSSNHPCLDWVIVGGESGSGARPCELEWIDSIVEQCKAAGGTVFVKQFGRHLAKRLGLKDLKGANWDEWTGELERFKIRQWPQIETE